MSAAKWMFVAQMGLPPAQGGFGAKFPTRTSGLTPLEDIESSAVWLNVQSERVRTTDWPIRGASSDDSGNRYSRVKEARSSSIIFMGPI